MEKFKQLLNVLQTMRDFRKVKFVFFYGSRSQRSGRKSSDIDVCIYYDGKTREEMEKFRLRILSRLPSIFDVQVFQLLPIYVRKEVLKGKIVYAKNLDFVYQKAFETIKEFESFKHRFYDYIGMKR